MKRFVKIKIYEETIYSIYYQFTSSTSIYHARKSKRAFLIARSFMIEYSTSFYRIATIFQRLAMLFAWIISIFIAIHVLKKLLKLTIVWFNICLPYSSNYNSIELTFSMLKIWMRRYFRKLWTLFESDFEDFIAFAIEKSECDKKTKEHFKHNIEEYMFESDYEIFRRKLDI